MLLFVATRQIQVLGWRPASLLDESVQQHHPPQFVDVEQYPRDPVLREVRPDFVNSLFQDSFPGSLGHALVYHRWYGREDES